MQSDGERTPERSSDHVRLASDHERRGEELVRERPQEDGVDVGVDAAVGEQRIKADEVAVVRVQVGAGDVALRVVRGEHLRREVHLDELQVWSDPLPPGPVGSVLVVEVDGLGLEHAAAGLDRGVVQEMERLHLLLQAEHEVREAGDHRSGRC